MLDLFVVDFEVFAPLRVGLTEIFVVFFGDVTVFWHFNGFDVEEGTFFGLENATEEFAGFYFVREGAVEFVDFAFSFEKNVDLITVKGKEWGGGLYGI